MSENSMSTSPHLNVCKVKYIDIASINTLDSIKEIDRFVRCERTIWHDKYKTLHESVFSKAPAGFVCVEPLALHHEVLWSSGITFSDGIGKRKMTERDQLHHAIEEGEYGILWAAGNKFSDPLSIFVDIVKEGASTAQRSFVAAVCV
jgi:hypothetical protein